MDDHRDEFGQPIGPPVTAPLPTGAPAATAMAGSRCEIAPLVAELHRAALFAAFGASPDDREWTYLPYGPFPDEASFGEWLAAAERCRDPMFFAVSDRRGPCGLASYLRIEPEAGSVEIGNIHFGRRLQRTAAATEAMFLMMRRAFDAGYRRYEWKCDALNAPSRAAATRLGFTFEGIFRQATVYKGRNRDTAWYSIIDAEWPAVRAEFERWLAPDNFDAAGRQLSPLRMPTRG